jgi:phosphatidylglycerophosphate synthase
MHFRSGPVWLVQSITLVRVVAAILFASIAFQNVPHLLISALYALAMITDVIDGYVARRLHIESSFGEVLDLIGDRSLTIVSLLYAAACGIDLLPLALIAARDLISMGARLIVVHGRQLLPINRVLGGAFAIVLWGTTLSLVIADRQNSFVRAANVVYWVCSIVLSLILVARILANAQGVKAALTKDE